MEIGVFVLEKYDREVKEWLWKGKQSDVLRGRTMV